MVDHLAPVPLIVPGKFVDLPEPKWRVKQKVVLKELAQEMKVMRLCEMPFPPASRLVYQSWQPTSLSELQSYARHVLEEPGKPPPCSARIYPDSVYVAHSLRPDAILRFDSHFESGNLSRAYALSESEYDLYITPDTNTRGHTQWFYFSVTKMKAGVTVKFNIVNFTKGNCLLVKGLRPVYQSQSSGPQWAKVQGDVNYSRNNYVRPIWKHSRALEDAVDDSRTGWYYTLTFYHTFAHSNDTVSFAFSEPYTLSRLLETIGKAELESRDRLVFRKEVVCETTLGLELPVLTITGSKSKGKKKQAVVFTARVHPGETPSSFIMEGLMKFLTEDTEAAKNLLSTYIFYFVPMLNPDGVLLGNYRSCVEGVDLNRRWCDPSFECIGSLRTFLQSILAERKIAMFCDLHAHAKKNNAFIYGCNTASEGGFTTWTKVRLFPRVLAKFSQFFNYEQCKFKVQKEKMGTGRVVLWKDFSVSNSFTLETSFHAYCKGTDLVEFQSSDYFLLSQQMMESLSRYSDLLEQFEQEVALNGGWLKPGKLKELTGIPAQQLALIEQEELLKKERYRQARLSNSFATPAAGVRAPRSTSAHHKRSARLPAADEPNDKVLSFMRGRRLRFRAKPEQTEGWRDYFSVEEMQTAWQQLKSGHEFEESDSSGSDSEPSEDNFSSSGDDLSSDEVPWPAEEEKLPAAATYAVGSAHPRATPEPESESQPQSIVSEKSSPSPSPVQRKAQSIAPAARFSPSPKIAPNAVPAAADFTPSATLPAVYPVSDINKILRDTHRSNVSFDSADVGRPRVRKNAKRGLQRSSSPLILIESYTMRKPAVREIRPAGSKTLSSAQRLGASAHTVRSVYSSKPVLAATTRFGGNARVTRREFQFDAIRQRPKPNPRPKNLDLTGLILG